MVRSQGLGDEGGASFIQPISLQPGERTAMFFHRLDEAYGTIVELLRDGIRQNELCVLLSGEAHAVVKERIRSNGLDPDREPSMILVNQSDYSMGGGGRPLLEASMRTLSRRARSLGYAGSRLILNVNEVMDAQLPTGRAWLELDEVRQELGITIVFLFDMSVFSPGFLLRALSYFPSVIISGALYRNFYYKPCAPSSDDHEGFYERLESIMEGRALLEREHRERAALEEVNRELRLELSRRQLVEFALLRAENDLRTMLDYLPDMVLMVDRNLKVTVGNQTFIRHLERSGMDASYEGMSIYDLFPGAKEGRRLFEEMFEHGHPTIVETEMPTRSGPQQMEVRLVPIKMGDKVDRLVIIARHWSITFPEMEVVKEWSQPLREVLLDPDAANAIRSCPLPVLMTDANGRPVMANQARGRLIGCAEEDILDMGRTVDLLSPRRGKDGMIRRIIMNEMTAVPSILRCEDGTSKNVLCFMIYGKEFGPSRSMTIVVPVD